MRAYRWLFVLALCALIVGCGTEVVIGGSDNAAPPPPPRGAGGPKTDGDAGLDGAKKIEFPEQDFVETERNRDPFRSFAATFTGANARLPTKQREVMLDRYSIEELKLVGIITGGAEHRAMLVDPTGKGWIVKRGQFVGKEEVVHSKGGTGADYALNWRVDRIRDGDIVLVREDPAHGDVPPATRVIPLRPDSETASSKH
ncbi:MAG: pilus assembly protein PilP [Deltaproteobacteria bacterium]|nr:pilus assembly protein PilP [Deltaproteobacteria bacterium]